MKNLEELSIEIIERLTGLGLAAFPEQRKVRAVQQIGAIIEEAGVNVGVDFFKDDYQALIQLNVGEEPIMLRRE